MSNQLSKLICVVCNYQLTSFCHAKRNLIKSQKELYSFLAKENTKKPIEIEEVIEEHLIEDENVLKQEEELKDTSKWMCHECQKSFSSGSSLTNHLAIYHTTTNIKLSCPIKNCSKKSKTKKQLAQHLKSHNEDKQICPECGLVVGNKHNLTKHIKRLHLKIYNFYCDLCDYKGFFKFNIDQHVSEVSYALLGILIY